MNPSFIVVEGLEGAGKSSVIELIRAFLVAKGHDVECTREPGGTPMAEAIRECVKQTWDEVVTQETELLLMYAARSQLVENKIKPAMAKNKWVIGDRHDMSSVAYQGGGRGIDISVLNTLRKMTLGSFEPDLVLYLDVEPSVGLARARGRGELDRIELSGLSFFENARRTYKKLVQDSSKAVEIDAMQEMNVVHSDVRAALENWYAKGCLATNNVEIKRVDQ
ncbi:dTMP kinase [Brumicola nitratireducens]|uniref:Thymidylate kinase n=1 Tax=Glaciecola nitratireducens (strain JCM 12485 / KCTC 12276 / FR1064) TaxID=1085623 RepID=G4QLI2_GLANF|nr:dTMP kinase [Glaciecola nitratireducens]AEP29849.1 thymidylate kinase [Glaciecola nitratireducens FR1064]